MEWAKGERRYILWKIVQSRFVMNGSADEAHKALQSEECLN